MGLSEFCHIKYLFLHNYIMIHTIKSDTMAKFAQYYLRYINDNLYAAEYWNERQKHFGALFEKNDSIDFTLQKGNGQGKTYKHDVRHISLNRNIIVMRIANDKTKEVIQDFKPKEIKHEPPCFVIIDNRDGCRRIAIQKNRDAFNTTDSLKDILLQVLHRNMMSMYNIGLELHPQFYPRDFYELWLRHQKNTQCLRFGLNVDLPADFANGDFTNGSIMSLAMQINEESVRSKYRSILELSSPEERHVLLVDYESKYIRNLVRYCSQTGAKIELVTSDGSRFTCFVDDDTESDTIITSEIDTKHLNALFIDQEELKREEARVALTTAEQGVVEFVNGMKKEVDNKEEWGDNVA